MKEVIYTMEQAQDIIKVLDNLQVQGVENCKRIILITQIIDNPKEEREVKEDEPTSTDKTDTVHK